MKILLSSGKLKLLSSELVNSLVGINNTDTQLLEKIIKAINADVVSEDVLITIVSRLINE